MKSIKRIKRKSGRRKTAIINGKVTALLYWRAYADYVPKWNTKSGTRAKNELTFYSHSPKAKMESAAQRQLRERLPPHVGAMMRNIVAANCEVGLKVKILVIMRGIRGCGKTWLAKAMREYMRAYELYTTIVSDDDYYYKHKPRTYLRVHRVEADRVAHEAHEMSLGTCLQAVENKAPLIIIDNENAVPENFASYKDFAAENNYHVRFVEFIMPEGTDIAAVVSRSRHVPGEYDGSARNALIMSSTIHDIEFQGMLVTTNVCL